MRAHRNVRSDLNAMVCFQPKDKNTCKLPDPTFFTRENEHGWTISSLDEIRNARKAGDTARMFWKRMDILHLVDRADWCEKCQRGTVKQYEAFPTPNGGVRYQPTAAEAFFSDEDKAWAREESARIWNLYQTNDDFAWALHISMDTYGTFKVKNK